MWKARIFTLYPEIFPGPLASGLYKKALEKKFNQDINDLNQETQSLVEEIDKWQM